MSGKEENNKKKAPELRFKGFTDDWEQRKFGGVGEFGKGKGFSKNDLSVEGEPIILYGRLYTNYQTIIKEIDTYAQPKGNDVLSSGSEVIVPSSGETAEDIARASVVGIKGVLLGGDLNIIKLKDDFHSPFIALSLSNGTGKTELIKKSQGTSVVHLYNSDLKEVNLFSPSLDEQMRISKLLCKLENLITLHLRKLEWLKRLRESFLQNLFPEKEQHIPRLRFASYQEDWEQRELNSIVTRIKSYSLSRNVETNINTGYKYIHYGDIHTGIADMIVEDSELPSINTGSYELLQEGDIVLADASEDHQGIAKPALVAVKLDYNLVAGLHTIALRPSKVDSTFLYYTFIAPLFRQYGYRTGTGMKVFGISVSNVLKFEGYYPSIDEQVIVGNFLRKIDKLIKFNEQKLEKLEALKKAYLQKMFL